MRGSLIIEKILDPMLRQQWEGKVVRLGRALRDLEKARENRENDPTNLEYFEAVTAFAAARDDERLFYWENFYEERTSDPDEGIRIKASK